jgi:fatty acid desaturase
MARALLRIKTSNCRSADRLPDWRKSMSDNIAGALLVYAVLQIFLTMVVAGAGGGTLLPYLTLALLVAGVIPASRMMERRWERLTDQQTADPALARRFRRDRGLVWLVSLGLPFMVAGLYKTAQLFS